MRITMEIKINPFPVPLGVTANRENGGWWRTERTFKGSPDFKVIGFLKPF